MLYVGCHVSSAKGFEKMGKDAVYAGGNTLQFFTRNPRGGAAKVIDEEDIFRFLKLCKEHNFGKIVAHAPYTLNPCSKDSKVLNFAKMVLSEDLKRMEYLPGNYYNLHPGSHVGQGSALGISMITELLNQVLFKEQTTIVLLETMAGKGSEVGAKFEEIREILEGVHRKDLMGVCLDTCHVHDAGYDVVADFEGVLDEFDRIIGLSYLKAVHLNDSLNPKGSHKDRHAKIGEGTLGCEAISKILRSPRLEGIPFLLETPNDLEGYKEEIRLLQEFYSAT